MKITEVRARVLAAKPSRPVEFGIGVYETFICVLVEVHTSTGLVGYGEAIARRGGAMTKAAVESLLAPVLIGKDPGNVGGLWQLSLDQLRRWGHSRGVVMEAISGVDIALWDVVSKAQGKPIWQVLHGVGRPAIPCYASSVYINEIDVMCKQARQQVERGFRAVKIKIGRSAQGGGIQADVEAVKQIRDAVGADVELMVDANGAYDAGTAVRVARGLEPYSISWFEEPVPPDDLDGYARVHAMSAIPVASGETEFSVFGFRDMLTRRAVDVVQPETARCGGITGACQVATMAFAHNVGFAPHTGFSGGVSHLAAVHVAVASPVLTTFEYMFIDNPLVDIFEGGFLRPTDGMLPIPEEPGLGLQLDLRAIERVTVP